ncbi:hypothetical protein FA13DRAFT_1718980 [Coprinellus micaceus]|uniref:Uncharacterized protein n=1 Tax=Coprinellus micaceus TaxID=71717 RepID=A0A4Y7SCH6_COPMI|nr:hypothetical protein FA13DRAFT_1718980 [Coprinellus micaceus]
MDTPGDTEHPQDNIVPDRQEEGALRDIRMPFFKEPNLDNGLPSFEFNGESYVWTERNLRTLVELIVVALWRIESVLDFPEEDRQWRQWVDHRFPPFGADVLPEQAAIRAQLLQRRLDLIEYILLGHTPQWLNPAERGPEGTNPVLWQMLQFLVDDHSGEGSRYSKKGQRREKRAQTWQTLAEKRFPVDRMPVEGKGVEMVGKEAFVRDLLFVPLQMQMVASVKATPERPPPVTHWPDQSFLVGMSEFSEPDALEDSDPKKHCAAHAQYKHLWDQRKMVRRERVTNESTPESKRSDVDYNVPDGMPELVMYKDPFCGRHKLKMAYLPTNPKVAFEPTVNYDEELEKAMEMTWRTIGSSKSSSRQDRIDCIDTELLITDKLLQNMSDDIESREATGSGGDQRGGSPTRLGVERLLTEDRGSEGEEDTAAANSSDSEIPPLAWTWATDEQKEYIRDALPYYRFDNTHPKSAKRFWKNFRENWLSMWPVIPELVDLGKLDAGALNRRYQLREEEEITLVAEYEEKRFVRAKLALMWYYRVQRQLEGDYCLVDGPRLPLHRKPSKTLRTWP